MLNVPRFILLNRSKPKLSSAMKVLLNFKILEFSKDIGADSMLLDVKSTDTPNHIITECITTLFHKFDKRLLINKSDSLMYMLQVGEKESFLAGEEPLYCYEEVIQAIQLRRDLKLSLAERKRTDVCSMTHPNLISTQIERIRVNAELHNLILWHFPMFSAFEDFKPPVGKLMTDNEVRLSLMNKALQLNSYYTPTQLEDVFLSSEVRNPIVIKLQRICEVASLFIRDDFIKDTLEKKRFAALQTVKNKQLLDDRQLAEGAGYNPLKSNSSEFLRALLKEYDIPKTTKPLPLLLFINARLFHGKAMLDFSSNIVMPVKNDLEFDDHELIFRNYTIDRLPLEARVAFEVSALYNNSYLKKLASVSYSLFDSNGILRTGKRVVSCEPEIRSLAGQRKRRLPGNRTGRALLHRRRQASADRVLHRE